MLQVRRTMHSKQHQKTHQGVKDAKNGTIPPFQNRKLAREVHSLMFLPQTKCQSNILLQCLRARFETKNSVWMMAIHLA